MTDESLMAKVSEGHLDHAAILYERYHLRIYNFFLKLTFNKEISQDLMQNVFLRILNHRKTFKPKYMFTSWIYKIAKNVYSDHFKKEGRFRLNFKDLKELNEEAYSLLEEKEKAEQVEILQKALAKLGEEHREVLIMTRYQKLKNKEVAAILNCKENAVKAKVHRAMKKLRNAYFEIENN